MEELTLTQTLELLELHINYITALKTFYENKKVKFRLPNFPEDISENIVKYLIDDIESISCRRLKTKGDLISTDNKQVEVKCFTSSAPSSFGPNEAWDILYFLDAKDFINRNFTLYKVNLSNTSTEFQNIPISSKQTYGNQCKEKRRPRMIFSDMRKHIDDHVTLLFNGNVKNHFDNVSIEKSLEKLTLNKNITD